MPPHARLALRVQACIGGYFVDQTNGRAAMEFAYEDVRRAFESFLRQTAAAAAAEKPVPGAAPRPIVLASHSQGGWHLLRLLQEVCVWKVVSSSFGMLEQRDLFLTFWAASGPCHCACSFHRRALSTLVHCPPTAPHPRSTLPSHGP